jgi:dethiobiotin synthetase
MRFGKTFVAYQLAKKENWKKILVLTFKPAVQHAWEEDLLLHKDFEGWQFVSKKGLNINKADNNATLIIKNVITNADFSITFTFSAFEK